MFENPILPGFYPDPSICSVGSDHYLATSTFEYFPGVPLFHSRDLVHWRQIGHALTRESQLPLAGARSSQGIFAPTLREHAGVFYLVTSNMSHGGSFYVTARAPGGPWSDPVWLPEPTLTMDPSLCFAPDGRVYYTRHGGGERGGIFQAELDLAAGRLRAEPRLIWSGTGGIWPEGPHLYAIGGYYYLLISEGGTSVGHRLTVARSRSPFGPFEACPHNPILTHADRPEEAIQATGHGDLVQTAGGQWWLVLLGIRRWDGRHHHLGRETFLAPVSWSADGWPVINGGEPIRLQMSSAGLPAAAPWPSAPERDDFDAPELEPCWCFLRNPAASAWSLRERPGYLRLRGTSASLAVPGAPAFVGRRQQHFRCKVAAQLSFAPERDGQRAGLTLRANEGHHHALVLACAGGERRVQLWTRDRGTSALLAERVTHATTLTLTIEAFPDRYELGFADGGSAVRLGSAPTAQLSSEHAGGFTGVLIGMFAESGDSSLPADMPPADFDWFDYRPLAAGAEPTSAERLS